MQNNVFQARSGRGQRQSLWPWRGLRMHIKAFSESLFPSQFAMALASPFANSEMATFRGFFLFLFFSNVDHKSRL